MPQQVQGFYQKIVNKKMNHTSQLPPTQTEQQFENHMLSLVDSILPSSMRPVNDTHTGVDYIFAGTKIDRKFGFYYGGKDSIRVRLNKTELINKSDFTMVMHPDRIDFFSTQKIRNYLRKHPKSAEIDIKQTPRIDKKTGKILFISARIKLSDLYAQEKVKPLSVIIPLAELARNKHHLKLRELAKLQERVERVLSKVQIQRILEEKRRITKKNLFYEKFVIKRKAQRIAKRKAIALMKKKIVSRR